LEIYRLTKSTFAAVNPETLTDAQVVADTANNKLILNQKTFDSTTLAAASSAGDLTITVASAAKLAVGDSIAVDSGNDAEGRTIVTIVDETITLSAKLGKDHESGTNVDQINYSKDITLTAGFNRMVIKISDKGGLSATKSLIIALDTTDPVVSVLTPIFPTGAISARINDTIIFEVNATDAGSGVEHVLMVSSQTMASTTVATSSASAATTLAVADASGIGVNNPIVIDTGTSTEVRVVASKSGNTLTLNTAMTNAHTAGVAVTVGRPLLTSAQIPELIRLKFGITGSHALFINVPDNLPPGTFSVTIRASDYAGETVAVTASGSIVASLEALNYPLSSGANLIGMNLQPTNPSIVDVLAQELDTTRIESAFATTLTAALADTTSAARTDASTLSAAASAGASVINLTTAGTLAAGDVLQIGEGTQTDTGTVLSVASNAVTLTAPLSFSHDSGVKVGEKKIVVAAVTNLAVDDLVQVETVAAKKESRRIAAIDTVTKTLTLSQGLFNTHANGIPVKELAKVADVVDSIFFLDPGSGATTTLGTSSSAGDTSITLDSISGFDVGDDILIDTRSGAEQRKITAINTATKAITVGVALTNPHGSGAQIATQGVFQVFSPSPNADTLTSFKQGRGYWLFTKAEAHKVSAPLPGFTTGTPIPITMRVDGVLFDATAKPPSLPTTVAIAPGFNLIALISELDRTVEQGMRGMLSPTRKFTSLVEFQNFMDFDFTAKTVEIRGGVFNPLFTGTGVSDMKITRGFYVYASSVGTHTP
jgi:sRNA-binding protein